MSLQAEASLTSKCQEHNQNQKATRTKIGTRDASRVHSPRFVFTYDARLYIELLKRLVFFVAASPLSKSWRSHSTRSHVRFRNVHSCHYVDCCSTYTYILVLRVSTMSPSTPTTTAARPAL